MAPAAYCCHVLMILQLIYTNPVFPSAIFLAPKVLGILARKKKANRAYRLNNP
jgi:hypothetical protein